ncbi:MAG: methylenetetrahydrofolate reductase, partial [Clostridia bacterium]|nr:methylenetetrahydrofolate reductase [Clostridia bacterium]
NSKERYNVPTLAHLTCVSSTKETVQVRIRDMQEAGIENVMALRGDLTPELKEKGLDGADYRYAIDLIRDIRESGAKFCIGGACYPEIHPESTTQAEDIRHLKEKVDAGCDFLTTQMFFDINLLYKFLYKTREAGITVPIIPGIMPITNANQIKRAKELSGSFMPQRFLSLVDQFGSSPDAMKQAGIIYATDQIIDLFANGIRNVHVYSMNNPDVAAKILSNLSNILK